jgi:ABC-type transport system substrate-binding protein
VRLLAPANPRYWRPGQPRLEAVQFDLRGDVDKGLALRAGDLHIADVPHDVAAQLRMDPRFTVAGLRDTTWYFVAFNNRRLRPPFDNPAVRRALAHVLDKPGFMRFVAGEAGVPTNQMVAPGNLYFDQALHDADPYAAPDLARARALLAEAGVDPARTRTSPLLNLPTDPSPRCSTKAFATYAKLPSGGVILSQSNRIPTTVTAAPLSSFIVG